MSENYVCEIVAAIALAGGWNRPATLTYAVIGGAHGRHLRSIRGASPYPLHRFIVVGGSDRLRNYHLTKAGRALAVQIAWEMSEEKALAMAKIDQAAMRQAITAQNGKWAASLRRRPELGGST